MRHLLPKVFIFDPIGNRHHVLAEADCEVLGKREWRQPGGGREAEMIAIAHVSQTVHPQPPISKKCWRRTPSCGSSPVVLLVPCTPQCSHNNKRRENQQLPCQLRALCSHTRAIKLLFYKTSCRIHLHLSSLSKYVSVRLMPLMPCPYIER
jgi:hypothetical protein